MNLRDILFILISCGSISGCIIPERTPKPNIDAINSLLPAAERGNAEAQYRLSLVYSGESSLAGVGLDTYASQRYLLLAAEKNFPAAQTELGMRYRTGTVAAAWMSRSEKLEIPVDLYAAQYWLERAARQHYLIAYYQLELLYGAPDTPLTDPIEACKWKMMWTPKNSDCLPSVSEAAKIRVEEWQKNNFVDAVRVPPR